MLHAEVKQSRNERSGNVVHSFDFGGDAIEGIDFHCSFFVFVESWCEVFGLAVSSEIEKLQATSWANIESVRTHDGRGHSTQRYAIPLARLGMWMVTVRPSDVAPSLQSKLRHHQDVLADFLEVSFGDVASGRSPAPAQPSDPDADVRKLVSQVWGLMYELAALAGDVDWSGQPQHALAPRGWFRLADWVRIHAIDLPRDNFDQQEAVLDELARRMECEPIRVTSGKRRRGTYFPRAILRAWTVHHFFEHPQPSSVFRLPADRPR